MQRLAEAQQTAEQKIPGTGGWASNRQSTNHEGRLPQMRELGPHVCPDLQRFF